MDVPRWSINIPHPDVSHAQRANWRAIKFWKQAVQSTTFRLQKHAVIATKDIMLLRPQHRAPNAHLNMAAPAQLFPSLPKVLPHNQNAISPAAAALTRLVPLQ